MTSKQHWEDVYRSKAPECVSWYQERAATSLRLIRNTGLPTSASIIDVGGGASTLVDGLLRSGYTALTVLDLSASALAAARARLGPRAGDVQWLEADITDVTLPECAFDLWHDRAVFHFLTSAAGRRAYLAALRRAVKPGGHVIVATFANDGPTRCSGLRVMRYGPEDLAAEFGAEFALVEHVRERHSTPSGTIQNFIYCRFRKSAQ